MEPSGVSYIIELLSPMSMPHDCEPQPVTRLTNNERMNQEEMKKIHLRKSFSDKDDLTL